MSPRKESRVVANKPLRRGFDPDVRLSKVEVMAAGVIAYWTGKPCKNGHLAHRYVCNSICVECGVDKGRKHAIGAAKKECKAAGVDPDLRRRAEELRERRRLERELAGWGEL